MSRLPFTTDDVREQCAQFGDAPLAHPLPVRDLLKMCQAIDDLELRHEIDARYIAKIEARVERAEAKWAEYQSAAEAYANDANNLKLRINNALVLCRSRPGSDAAHYLEPVRRALEPEQ